MLHRPHRYPWPRRPFAGDEAGAAAVEFALLVPLLLAIVFGIIVYSLYFTVQIAVTEAASVGARAAVAGLSCTERTNLATAAVTNFFKNYGGFLGAAQPHTPVCGTGTFQVTVSYDITSLKLGLMGGFVPVPGANPTATVTVSTGGL